MTSMLTSVCRWLERCLDSRAITILSVSEVGRGSGCPVFDCRVEAAGSEIAVILKVYRPGFDDYSGLGAVDTARKQAAALTEMPEFGVPTPRVLGFGEQGEEAAVVTERAGALPWAPETRIEAARILGRLHRTAPTSLSVKLADLVRRSRPNRDRVGRAPREPAEPRPTLVHGDYFSVNILRTGDGLRIVDWDLLALGDPMWDLGFLLEADRGVTEAESAAVIAAYQAVCPVASKRLAWQRECWRAYWRAKQRDADP